MGLGNHPNHLPLFIFHLKRTQQMVGVSELHYDPNLSNSRHSLLCMD